MTAKDDNITGQGADSDSGSQGRPLLGLQIPKQLAPKADNLLLDPKETEAWFESLPMANIGETARQIYNTLVEFNLTILRDDKRHRIKLRSADRNDFLRRPRLH